MSQLDPNCDLYEQDKELYVGLREYIEDESSNTLDTDKGE